MEPEPFGISFNPSSILSQAGCGYLSKMPLHRNEGLEILFLEHGHLTWIVDGRRTEIDKGSIFYTFPWETHGSAREFEPGHFWYFAAIRGDGPHPNKKPMSFQRLGLERARSAEMMRILQSTPKRCWPASERLATTLKELVEETRHKKSWNDEAFQALAKLVLIELVRIVSDAMAPLPPIVTHFPQQKIQMILDELKARPDKKWTLPGMATQCGLHRTHFTNAVRHLTGDTPLLHLRRLRIERAREILLTEVSITEIAFACGFESSQHFARIFRQFTGQSATAYRKASRSS